MNGHRTAHARLIECSMAETLAFRDRDGRRISAVLDRPRSIGSKGVVLCHGLFGFKDSVTNRVLSRILNER
jgi:hypothetical protein